MMPRVLEHDASQVADAVNAALEIGQTLVFPTDTIYGIGGNPWDARALERVRALKGRPTGQPFALLLPSVRSVSRYATLDARLSHYVDRLLPGPFTLLVPAAPGAPPSSIADGKVGVRVPAHPFFQHTMARLDRPLFGTSVNRHGEPPLADVGRIIERFVNVDLIVVGPTGAAPSAIVDLTETPPHLVRGELTAKLRALLDEE